MRKLVIAGLLTAATGSVFLGGTKNADAYDGPWCHTWGGAMGGIENCRIQTLEMCRYEIRGNGGFAKSALAGQSAGTIECPTKGY